jgi:2-polyprenyl-3-methyl-5-hydroxy-6-metoxy-1,4-benzoquinol methylase
MNVNTANTELRSLEPAGSSQAVCPLCRGDQHLIHERISAKELCELYEQQLGLDVKALFSGVDSLTFMECGACGLGHYNPPLTGDAQFYDRIQNESWYYLRAKYEYEFVSSLITSAESVLDVGSGEGAFARHLPYVTAYTGLDMSPEAIRKAQGNGIRVVNESVEKHAESCAGRYDTVVSFQSLEHVSDPHSFITAAAQCVAPNGKLVVAVPSEDSFLHFASNSPLNMPPHHVTRWSDRALHGVARVTGMRLSLLHHEPLQDIHRDWAMTVLARTMFGFGKKQIEGRGKFSGRVRARLASMIARLLKSHLPRELQPTGHTVIAIYSR